MQDFISIFYGSLVRFYQPVVQDELLGAMEEDLIELATSLTINEKLSPWLLKICRMTAREDEKMLTEKLTRFTGLLPEQVGIGQYFTCN